MHNELAGILHEDQDGYHFRYQEDYLQRKKAEPVSLTLPLQAYEMGEHKKLIKGEASSWNFEWSRRAG